MNQVLTARGGEHRERCQVEDHMKTEIEFGGTQPQVRNARAQKLEEARNNSSLEPWGEHGHFNTLILNFWPPE